MARNFFWRVYKNKMLHGNNSVVTIQLFTQQLLLHSSVISVLMVFACFSQKVLVYSTIAIQLLCCWGYSQIAMQLLCYRVYSQIVIKLFPVLLSNSQISIQLLCYWGHFPDSNLSPVLLRSLIRQLLCYWAYHLYS